ncbi:MAG: histidine kinase N-terminal 7TM domain-containing protein [Patescibacteria group bacterium]
MSAQGIVLLIIASLEVILGIYIVLRYQRSEINLWYVLFIFSVALWVGTNSYIYLTNPGGASYEFEKISWFAGVLVTATFLMFSFYFPYKSKTISPHYLFLVIIPVLFFTPYIFAGKLFLEGIKVTDQGYGIEVGPLFYLFPIFFLVYWSWAITNLFKKFKVSDGVHHWQLKYLLIGVIVPVAIITITDIFLPWLSSSKLGWVGSASSAIWLGFTTYIILKK